jgi:hypothetical protein
MPLDPSEPAPPRRIIMPGDTSVPAPPEQAAGEHAAGEPADDDGAPHPPPGGSRIVLPPGVAREELEDLPEYPRLRPLEILAVREGDRDLLLVNDPLGVMPAPIALKIDALDMLRVLDGSFSLNDLAAEVVRASKDLRRQLREGVRGPARPPADAGFAAVPRGVPGPARRLSPARGAPGRPRRSLLPR